MHRIPFLNSFRSGKIPIHSLYQNNPEQTSLLTKESIKDYQTTPTPAQWEDVNFKLDNERAQAISEFKALLAFGLPILATFILSKVITLSEVWFLGKLGSEVMAIVSLSNLFATITGFALGNGILSAVDTLVAQAYTGSNNPHTIGIILQRSMIIVTIFALPVCYVWINAESILVFMGQDPSLSHKAQEYILCYIPVLFLTLYITALRKYLQGIKQMEAIMYAIILSFPFSLMYDYLFLIYWDMSYIGASLYSCCFTLTFSVIYVIVILKLTDFKRYWPGVSKECLKSWGVFLNLGIPGMMSQSTDWAFEVCAIATGVLDKASLAAQSVVLVVNGLLLMFPWALGTALIVRLGHHLGANEPKKTRLCVSIATVSVLGFASINASLMYIFRGAIASYFTTEFEVIESIESLMKMASLCQFVTGFGIIFSCTLNAFGRQSTVAGFNLISYYLIGLPFGLHMTMNYNWGLVGVWSGVALAGFLKAVGEGLVILFTIDWENECRKSAKRIDTQETAILVR